MSWAARRRFMIMFGVGATVVAVFAIIAIAAFYKAPSCTDGIQNENERGIDCGGPCRYLCAADEQPPTVLFTQAILKGGGLTDIVASIENQNAGVAAKQVPDTITLYGKDQVLVQQVSGTLDLPPPSGTVPIYVPNISSGNQTVLHAFLTIDPTAVAWYLMPTDPRVKPTVSDIALTGASTTPRLDATLANGTVAPLANVQVIAFIRDVQDKVIAASQTILPSLPAQGQATATFTWNAPFSAAPAAVEVTPIIPLP